VPDENPVSDGKSESNPLGDKPSVGGEVKRFTPRRSPKQPPSLRKIGDPLPEVRKPVAPDPVQNDLLSEKNKFRVTDQPDEKAESGKAEGATAPTNDKKAGQPKTTDQKENKVPEQKDQPDTPGGEAPAGEADGK
jgi:hypothetical protein